ncbi:LysR family transcriptional regulator [Streptomyces sp. NPDC049906]|uniref:LysR family transcriptional regulator n=1 Tax=Streptomyces sp. NPDC049906 TaxID=3155656 RepID=UPI0034245465
MDLEVRHLRALCAIADTGSLHKAARALGVAQPTLSTQLRRIEQAVGGRLFTRERSGCRPTPLGRFLLGRARPLVAEMRALVNDTRAAAARTCDGTQLLIGSTASRALPGWLRRLRLRHPGTEPTLQMDVSPNALLGMVADGQLDVAFVHEVEGSPLRFPAELHSRILVEREPQFVALAADHPAAAHRTVPLDALADDRWMVDATVDGEWDAVCRVLREADLNPRVLHGDYLTAYTLVATGEVVTVSQPTTSPRPDTAVRPLRGDPIGVRLLLVARSRPEVDAVFDDLAAAYWEAAAESPAYARWLADRPAPPPRTALPPDPPPYAPRPVPARALPGRTARVPGHGQVPTPQQNPGTALDRVPSPAGSRTPLRSPEPDGVR